MSRFDTFLCTIMLQLHIVSPRHSVNFSSIPAQDIETHLITIFQTLVYEIVWVEVLICGMTCLAGLLRNSQHIYMAEVMPLHWCPSKVAMYWMLCWSVWLLMLLIQDYWWFTGLGQRSSLNWIDSPDLTACRQSQHTSFKTAIFASWIHMVFTIPTIQTPPLQAA